MVASDTAIPGSFLSECRPPQHMNRHSLYHLKEPLLISSVSPSQLSLSPLSFLANLLNVHSVSLLPNHKPSDTHAHSVSTGTALDRVSGDLQRRLQSLLIPPNCESDHCHNSHHRLISISSQSI